MQSVTLRRDESVTVTGTMQCNGQGYHYNGGVEVRQRTSGNVNNRVTVEFSGICETVGPTAFTATGVSEKPFHTGPATVHAHSTTFAPDFSYTANWDGGIEAAHIH